MPSRAENAERQGFQGLVQAARGGDRSAMDRVLEIMRPHLESLARMYSDPRRPSESSNDLLQETCVRAWKKIDTFQGADNDEETFAMFRVWMGQIVRRPGMNAARDGATGGRIPPDKLKRLGTAGGNSTAGGRGGAGQAIPATTKTPSAHVSATEMARHIRQALDALEDETAASIVRMRYFDGLTIPQIADQMDMTPVRVRERYRSAMRRLKRDLGEWL